MEQNNTQKKAIKLKTYLVVRTILEKYEVMAPNKKEAMKIIEDPFEVTVQSEKIIKQP
jgi:hypothetical protein